jgi:hypothetical protein
MIGAVISYYTKNGTRITRIWRIKADKIIKEYSVAGKISTL